jgi:hypothetical protein
MAKVQSWYMNQGEWSCHALRWHLRDLRGFLDDVFCFWVAICVQWTQFKPSPPKPWKIHNHANAFQPSMAQSTTVKTKSSGVLASCIPPRYWWRDTWMWNQMCIMQCRMKLYGSSHVAFFNKIKKWHCFHGSVWVNKWPSWTTLGSNRMPIYIG